MLFVEAGFQELDDQVIGRSWVRKDGFAWAKITRDIIVGRAKHLLDTLRAKTPEKLPTELSVEVLRKVKISQGTFRDRWGGQGAMSNSFMCMVRYACTDAQQVPS